MSKENNVLVDPINRVDIAGKNQNAEPIIKVVDNVAIKFNIPTNTKVVLF